MKPVQIGSTTFLQVDKDTIINAANIVKVKRYSWNSSSLTVHLSGLDKDSSVVTVKGKYAEGLRSLIPFDDSLGDDDTATQYADSAGRRPVLDTLDKLQRHR